jgi:predicted MFS family arabinose efflux permease
VIRRPIPSQQLLREVFHRDFSFFFLAQAISLIGSGMAPVAVSFAVLQDSSTSLLGVVLMARSLPQIVGFMLGGVLADRLGRRLMMVVANAVGAISQVSLGLIILGNHARPWHFIVFSAITGLSNALFGPAASGIVPMLVAKEHLQKANGVLGVGINGSRVLGTALAGIIVASTNPGWAIVVDGISFALAGLLIVLMRARSGSGKQKNMLTELRIGWNDFVSRRWIWQVGIVSSLVTALFFGCFSVLGPKIAKTSLHGARGWSAILTAATIGLLVGAAIASTLTLRLFVVVPTTLALPFCLLLLGLGAPVAVMLVVGFLAGASISIFDIYWTTLLQHHVSNETLSRVAAWDMVAMTVFSAIVYPLIGPIERVLRTRGTVLLGVTLIVICTLSYLTAGVPKDSKVATLETAG